jgi:hypothetical protein
VGSVYITLIKLSMNIENIGNMAEMCNVEFEVLSAMVMKSSIFWDIMLCKVKGKVFTVLN